MNAKAVLTFTFLVLFGNYTVIGESFVEPAKHNYKITPGKIYLEHQNFVYSMSLSL